jgi:hypothetical protein
VSKIGTDFTIRIPAELIEFLVIFEEAMDEAATQRDLSSETTSF